MTNDEDRRLSLRHSGFCIRHSFDIRISSFVIPSTWIRTQLPLACLLLALALAAGCQGPSKPVTVKSTRETPRQTAGLDPCANRLHDLCEPLLMYYVLNKRLPHQLSELSAMGDVDNPLSLACPVSGQTYVYNPGGFTVAKKPGRIIIYDATPCHDGLRWAISVQESDGPLITRVVAISEDEFSEHVKPAK